MSIFIRLGDITGFDDAEIIELETSDENKKENIKDESNNESKSSI